MQRTILKAVFRLDSDWRIGVWKADEASKQGTARHVDGTPYLPGSSVVGALRESVGSDALGEALFGASKVGKTVPSRWWLMGVHVGSDTIVGRKRTAIDRFRRSAAMQGLHESEQVQVGQDSEVALYWRLDADEPDELLAQFLDVLKTWEAPRFGGGVSQGLGRALLTSIVHRTFDFRNVEDVLAWVDTADGGPRRYERLLNGAAPVKIESKDADQPFLEVVFQVPQMASPVDGRLVQHGSQWKGLLRSRVEFIARSLGHPACISPDVAGSESSKWTGCGRPECGLCQAFGSAETGIGAWEFEATAWAGRRTADTRQRIAIDRFTGGTFQGALYPESTVAGVELTLRIRQRVRRSRTSDRSSAGPSADAIGLADVDGWVRQALLHAIRDIDDGLVSLSGRGGIGLGIGTVTSLAVNGEPVEDPAMFLSGLGAVELPQGGVGYE